MLAKFSTKNSATDYFRYVRKNALIMVAGGIVFGIAGLAAGIALLAVAGNVPGGTVLLIAGVLIASGLIIYGLYGLKIQYLRNTLITGLESNVTEFNDDYIKITQTGNGIRVDNEYGYMHIARIIEDDESYQIELNNNNLILCTKQSMLEDSVEDLDDFLVKKLGNKFINRSKTKFATVSAENKCESDITDVKGECNYSAIDPVSDESTLNESKSVDEETSVNQGESNDSDTGITQ